MTCTLIQTMTTAWALHFVAAIPFLIKESCLGHILRPTSDILWMNLCTHNAWRTSTCIPKTKETTLSQEGTNRSNRNRSKRKSYQDSIYSGVYIGVLPPSNLTQHLTFILDLTFGSFATCILLATEEESVSIPRDYSWRGDGEFTLKNQRAIECYNGC